MADYESLRQVERIEAIVEQLEHCHDPALRAASRELVDAVLALHRDGLARLVNLLANAGPAGHEALQVAAAEPLLSNLLLLHDLHPASLESRVQKVIDELRQSMPAAEVTLVEVSPHRVRLRFQAPDDPAAYISTQRALEEAILGAAPDVLTVECLGVSADTARRYLPLPVIAGAVSGKHAVSGKQ